MSSFYKTKSFIKKSVPNKIKFREDMRLKNRKRKRD